MNKHQLVRYKVLDRCFRNPVGCFSIQDLVELCSKALSYERATDLNVSERTIRDDIRDFKELYGAEFDDRLKDGHKKLYRYSDTSFSIMPVIIPGMTEEQKMLAQVLEMLSGYDEVPQYEWLRTLIVQRINGVSTDAQSVIGFQNNPDLMGMDHFRVLMNAILAKQVLEVIYKPYKGSSASYVCHPYYLKQYNDRWFLIAKSEGHTRLSVLPLDRIISTKELHLEFVETNIDMETYFDDIVGVTKDERTPIEDVLIKISHTRYPYIKTKPLHYSQTEIKSKRDEDGVVVRIRVRINKELEAAILQLGSDAEVLSPDTFRSGIAQKIQLMNSKYQNSANTLQG